MVTRGTVTVWCLCDRKDAALALCMAAARAGRHVLVRRHIQCQNTDRHVQYCRCCDQLQALQAMVASVVQDDVHS